MGISLPGNISKLSRTLFTDKVAFTSAETVSLSGSVDAFPLGSDQSHGVLTVLHLHPVLSRWPPGVELAPVLEVNACTVRGKLLQSGSFKGQPSLTFSPAPTDTNPLPFLQYSKLKYEA